MFRTRGIKLTILLTMLACCAGVSLAKKFTLTASQKVPSASGEIDTKTDKNGNTEVDVTVRNLAKAGNLTPPATTYVVWFEQQNAPPANEGELKVDDKLKGELKTSTPWKNFDVYITSETDPLVKMPSGEPVLRSKVQM